MRSVAALEVPLLLYNDARVDYGHDATSPQNMYSGS